ncbi:MAG: hypothetical protein HOO06_13995 [Bdellovibrionaceae bacterium]|nr:hypothetical protein [Pseudobdellovibrionaceae bacterium]
MNQFRERLACYSYLKEYGFESSSEFYKFNRIPQIGVDYTAAIFKRNPGYIVILPGKSPPKSNNRGFYVFFNDGIYWQSFESNPDPDGKVLDRRYKINIPGLKNNIYVNYPDFINSDGSEYGNINIGINWKPVDGKVYDEITPGEALTSETESLFAKDLIIRIKDVPRVFLNHKRLRADRISRNVPVGNLKNESEFIKALNKCKKGLRETKDRAIVDVINTAISNIETKNEQNTIVRPNKGAS